MSRPNPPVINSNISVLEATRGQAFSFQPSAAFADKWRVSQPLPSGLTINETTGLISGTPQVAGVFQFGLIATLVWGANSGSIGVFPSTDLIAWGGHDFENGERIYFTEYPERTIWPNLETGILYYIINSNPGAGTFQVALSADGAAVELAAQTGDYGAIGNFDIDSEPLLITLPIAEPPLEAQIDELYLDIDWNLITGQISIPGTSGASWGPPGIADGIERAILGLKMEDRFPVRIGLRQPLGEDDRGALQDLPITALAIGSKEFEPERFVAITESGFEKIGSGNQTRYKKMVYVNPASWRSILSNYESDGGTFVDALGEIRLEIASDSEEYEQEQIQTYPNLTGGQSNVKTWNFLNLPQGDVSKEYTATFTLDIPEKPSQNVSLERTFDLVWNGNLYVVSNLAGDASGQGTNEPPHWRTTLTNTSLAGAAGGLVIGTAVDTTTGEIEEIIRVDLRNVGVDDESGTLIDFDQYYPLSEEWELYDYRYEYDESFQEKFGDVSLTAGDDAETIQGYIEALGGLANSIEEIRLISCESLGLSPIIGVFTGRIEIVLKSWSILGAVWSLEPSEIKYYRLEASGDVYAATLTVAIFETNEGTATQRKTSRTMILRLERSINPTLS